MWQGFDRAFNLVPDVLKKNLRPITLSPNYTYTRLLPYLLRQRTLEAWVDSRFFF